MAADLVPLGQGDGGDITDVYGDDYSAAAPPSPRRGPRNPEVDRIIEEARDEIAKLDVRNRDHQIKIVQINRKMETRIRIAKMAARGKRRKR